jgi:RNA polymerase sigma-70 factor (ECF subfamily)
LDDRAEDPVPQALTEQTNDPTPALGGAAEALFAEQAPKAFRAAFRITGNAMDAEDVVQTVFLRLLRQSQPPTGEGAGGYVYRSAVNGALDLVRSRNRAGWVPLETDGRPAVALADTAPEPDREAELSELRRALRLALARLAPRAAEIFALRYFEGLGNREIAELTGTSAGVVAVLLHRTRARLRRELENLLGETS